MDWEVWRVVSSQHLRVSLIEVQTQWSLVDLLDAHEVLDMIAEAQAQAQQNAES